MTMIEKVAAAIHNVDHSRGYANPAVGQVGPGETYKMMAKAAIEAMREPTDTMRKAGHDVIPDNEGFINDAACVYMTMIDAALKEQG